jgi:hypothetical protein
VSTQAITPDFIPAGPDFIPASGSSSPDFIPIQGQASAPPESQSSAMMRFIKAAGSRLYAGTAGAGPQQSGTMTQDFSAQQAQAKAGTLPSAWQTLKDSASDASPSNIDIGRTLSSVNPIDTQRFQSGDVAGGLGASAANLLMLRQAFKAKGVPEGGAPNTSEVVQPLTGGTKVGQQKLLPAAPIELGPSSITPQTQEGLLPAARKVYDDGTVQYLTRPLRPGESPDVYKNTNSNVQEYFINKMRDALERQTVTGSTEQDAAMDRMAQYAKTPVDSMQGKASGPVEAPQFAYRTRDAGSTGIMPNSGKTAQASLDPAKVQSYQPGRAQAQNHPQELVRVDLSKLDPSEYEIKPNGYVNFKGPVPESFIERMGGKAAEDTPRVPTSDADMMDLLMKSIQKAGGKARSAKAGDD